MPQNEQLRLIKTLAFEGEQNLVYKDQVNEMCRDSSDILLEKRTQTQFIQREKDRLAENIQPLEFPLTVADGEVEEDCIANYRQRLRTFNKRITVLLDQKADLSAQLQDYVYAKAELDMTNTKIDERAADLKSMTEQKEVLEEKLQDVPDDLEDQLQTVRVQIEYLEVSKECNTLQEQFDKIYKEEQEEWEAQKEQLERTLWRHRGREKGQSVAQDELDNYVQQLDLWEKYQQGVEKLTELCDELEHEQCEKDQLMEHYNELIGVADETKTELYTRKEKLAIAAEQLALEKELIECPECGIQLRWQDKKLVSVHDHTAPEDRDYEEEIKNVEQELVDLESQKIEYQDVIDRIKDIDIPRLTKTDEDVYSQMKQQVQVLTGYIAQNIEREKDLARIEKMSNGEPSPALKSIQQQITAKEVVMDRLKPDLSDVKAVLAMNLNDLRSQIHELTSKVERYQDNTEQLAMIEEKISGIVKELKKLRKIARDLAPKVNGINTDAIKKRITTVERDITKAKKKQAEDESLTEKVDNYLVYKSEQKELDRWEEKLAVAVKELKKAEKVHTAHLVLKEKYIQAEIMAVESTIDSINEHTRYYLDTFFAEHQLSVDLKAASKGKKIQTLKIDNTINYKGNEYDSLSQMSGGEFDRCTLASICGINTMLGSPILILDESLASLDADMNTEIISFLREIAQDKLILVCSHEAVQGIFDDVVKF